MLKLMDAMAEPVGKDVQKSNCCTVQILWIKEMKGVESPYLKTGP
jgi:hypothetical protein